MSNLKLPMSSKWADYDYEDDEGELMTAAEDPEKYDKPRAHTPDRATPGNPVGVRKPEGLPTYRRKSVSFSVFVSRHRITPYSEVYGQHPRDFDFDARGNFVPRMKSTSQRIHAREVRVGPTSMP